MKKRMKSVLALALSLALAITLVPSTDVAAAKKKAVKLSVAKKITVYKGSTKTVTLKNVKAKDIKSVKWTTSKKKVATVKKSSKTKAKIKAVKKGSATITCKVKLKKKGKYTKKSYTLKTKVTVKNKPVVTPAPAVPDNTTPTVTATPAPTTSTTDAPVKELNAPEAAVAGALYAENFDDGIGKFQVRGPSNSNIKLTVAPYGMGGTCLKVSDRTALNEEDGTTVGKSWSGTQIELSSVGCEPGKSYTISAWVMANQTIRDPSAAKDDNKRGVVLSKIEVLADGTESSDFAASNLAETGWFSNKYGVKLGTWVNVSTTITMPSEGDMRIYFETPGVSLIGGSTVEAGGKSVDFYIDSFSVKELTGKIDSTQLPSLADTYRGLLDLGTALGSAEIRNSLTMANVVRQYKSADPVVAAATGSSITMGNEMKPDAILGSTPELVDATEVTGLPASYQDAKVPVLHFDQIDETLKLAKQYGFKMRGHVLVWHSQTTDWFFREDFDSTKGFVSEEVMTGRQEWYIKSVLEHVQNAEGGEMIYCWDVVNEAFKVSGGGLREAAPESDTKSTPDENKSKWMSVYGDNEFIVNAFKFARTYANEGIELYYNDYNEYYTAKTADIYDLAMKLKEIEVNGKPIIDGIGMQMHLNYEITNDMVETAIRKFDSTGLKVQITELDMTHSGSEKSDEFAAKYRSLFEMFVELKAEGINLDKVIIWGTCDEASWRSEGYPLLFRTGFQPKMAFWEVINAGRVAAGLEELTYTEDDYYKDRETIA